METRTLGVLGAISSLVVLPGMAVGAPAVFQPAVAPAHSFAELLDPIPNAVARLKIADAQDAVRPRLIKAQYYEHHHHHHHHHAYIVRRYHPYYRRHGYRYGYPYGGYVAPVVPYFGYQQYQEPYFEHHHHHHHHQQDGF